MERTLTLLFCCVQHTLLHHPKEAAHGNRTHIPELSLATAGCSVLLTDFAVLYKRR